MSASTQLRFSIERFARNSRGDAVTSAFAFIPTGIGVGVISSGLLQRGAVGAAGILGASSLVIGQVLSSEAVEAHLLRRGAAANAE